MRGIIHTSELNWSEIDLSQKRSECERSNANWDRSKRVDLKESESDLKESESDLNESESEIDLNESESEIDLNECEHFLKANWDRSKRVWKLSQSELRSI